MNLLMIIGDPTILDGTRGAFRDTLKAFSPEWDRIDVICPRSPHARTMQTFFGNVHVHPSPYGSWLQPRWIRQQGRKLHAIYKHAVITVRDEPPFLQGRGALRLARETGTPCVLEIHQLMGYPRAVSLREYVGRFWSRFRLPRTIRRVSGARVVSKTMAETLMRWGAPKTKIHVVPSFYLSRSVFEQVGEPPPVQYDAVCCGSLTADKQVHRVLEAIASLKRARLLIIGDGPERPRLERLAGTLGIAHRVEFRGWLPTQSDMLQAMRSARLYVLNSASEGGPLVALEAMACGMSVITTPVGVMPDVIVDGVNGLFTTGAPDDLSLKLQRLLDDVELRERMGEEARGVLDRFERERLITMYAHFLRSFA